ncbi:MAG: hypothetical protein B7W98_03090, partial [Parcubacteria group bacterium 20-58-5]
MLQHLRLAVDNDVPIAELIEAAQGIELEFEHNVWPFKLVHPLMVVAGAWVQRQVEVKGKDPLDVRLWLFDKVSVNGLEIKKNAKGWRALDVTYNFRKGEGSNWFYRAMDELWVGQMRNAQAVRNRKKLVQRELRKAILETAKRKAPGDPVRILSLAAGSGQVIIEVLEDMRKLGVPCRAELIDYDSSAIDEAGRLVRKHHVADWVTLRTMNVLRGLWKVEPESKDIADMCGLVDYLTDTQAVGMFERIEERLKPGGYFLTCHIHPNVESHFMRYGINWEMIYRTPEEFQSL